MQDEWGISDGYFDVDGAWHTTSVATRDRLREAMGVPVAGPPMWFVEAGTGPTLHDACRIVLDDGRDLGVVTALPTDLPIGYHDLVPEHGGVTTRLIVHPSTCPAIPRQWGVAAQIYALWTEGSWGVGDLRDLATLARSLSAAGGAAILVSPLHQPAPSLPQQNSPYYPSSRRAWNPLLLAIEGPAPADLAAAPHTLVDRDAVWTAKRAALTELHDRSDQLPPLPNAIALWNALCDEHGPQWRQWPVEFRRFDLSTIATKLRDDREFARRATFHQWCQQLVATQLKGLAETGVDIIGDLAVGFSPDGADAWEYQDLIALDVRIGAPPDPFSIGGQEWGIPPFVPWKMRRECYKPFIDTIRATLVGMQGLRIDHVMGLFRQYWVPIGTSATDGAYVAFPSEELLAIICIEATRAGAYVVGEDLGTVEPGVRERLAASNIASTRVLWFEDEPPSEWPASALATITTHDLPTVAGVYLGTDGDPAHQRRLAEVAGGDSLATVIDDVHAALLAAPSHLRLLALDDVCAATERPNRPGTVDHLNWRRRLPLAVDAIELPVTSAGHGIDSAGHA